MIDKFEGRYAFLSNIYPCKIEHQGITYPSVDYFNVAMKVNDQQLINGKYYTPGDFREMVSKIESVKKIDQLIKVRKDWDENKLKLMEFAINQKFKNSSLTELLIATGDEILIDGNFHHDNFFGSCYCNKCQNKGENHLGKILMKVREKIKNDICQ